MLGSWILGLFAALFSVTGALCLFFAVVHPENAAFLVPFGIVCMLIGAYARYKSRHTVRIRD